MTLYICPCLCFCLCVYVFMAQTVLTMPALRDGLHLPVRYPMLDPPTGTSQEEWSRAMAQATSNG